MVLLAARAPALAARAGVARGLAPARAPARQHVGESHIAQTDAARARNCMPACAIDEDKELLATPLSSVGSLFRVVIHVGFLWFWLNVISHTCTHATQSVTPVTFL